MKLFRIVCVILVSTGVLTGLVSGSEWRGSVFELRQDRLYFPVGEEGLIFENAPFVIVRGADTIASGYIEHSWEGICVSAKASGYFDTIPRDSLEAVIMQAEIDSVETIKIGSEISSLTLLTDTTRSDRVRWIEYENVTALKDDFAAGLLDAAVSFSDIDECSGDGNSLAVPSPFIAVMMPNVGRPFNYRGELTTSLYYRFDDRRLALCFHGDEVGLVHRLGVSGSETTESRWYAFDPSRGKKLLDRITPRPSRVSLFSGHRSLEGVVHYFADLLARDRLEVELSDDRGLADISIDFIPCDVHFPRVGVDTLLRLMESDSVGGTPPAEYLRRVKTELAQLETSRTAADTNRHLEKISRIMAEDLGLFPLFRPTLHVNTHQRLRNVKITPEGYIDCRAALMVRLPDQRGGGGR